MNIYQILKSYLSSRGAERRSDLLPSNDIWRLLRRSFLTSRNDINFIII